MTLACARKTHFSERDARRIVVANLRDLFEHCGDVDASVRKAAHHIVLNYGRGGLPCVQQLIAEAMLGLTENVLQESTEISQEVWTEVSMCSCHLENVMRALEKPQRQRWVSLLVRVLLSRQPFVDPNALFSDFQLLWRADDDPRRSFAARHRKRAYMLSAQDLPLSWIHTFDILCLRSWVGSPKPCAACV